MARTIFFFLIFWFGLMISLILLMVYYLLKWSGFEKAERVYVYYVTNRWARFTLFTAGIKLDISGIENIPGNNSGFVVISNHQGNFDIPVFIASLPFSAGFISKKELMNMPFLSSWMKALNCVFIDRNNPRDSRGRLIDRINHQDKNPIFLFPEGTRSRGPEMGAFRTGSLKLLFQNRIDVVPVTINGTYLCYEKHRNIRSGRVGVDIHPVLHATGYELNEFEKFNEDLQKIIAGSLVNSLSKH